MPHYASIKRVTNRELVRRQVLQKLLNLKRMCGNDAVGQVLLASVSKAYTVKSKHWIQLGQGDLFVVLRGLGVDISLAGRNVSVVDGAGKFSFVDDYYWSGITYLVSDFAEALHLNYSPDLGARYPKSLVNEIAEAGMWDPSTPEISANLYLTGLHRTNNYDTGRLKLRLQGGEFKGLRKLAPRSAKPVAFKAPFPTGSLYRRRCDNKPSVYALMEDTLSQGLSTATASEWPRKASVLLKTGYTNRSREELNALVDAKRMRKLRKYMDALPPTGDTEQYLATMYELAQTHLGLTVLEITACYSRLFTYIRRKTGVGD